MTQHSFTDAESLAIKMAVALALRSQGERPIVLDDLSQVAGLAVLFTRNFDMAPSRLELERRRTLNRRGSIRERDEHRPYSPGRRLFDLADVPDDFVGPPAPSSIAGLRALENDDFVSQLKPPLPAIFLLLQRGFRDGEIARILNVPGMVVGQLKLDLLQALRRLV